jgi:hypothetical protein
MLIECDISPRLAERSNNDLILLYEMHGLIINNIIYSPVFQLKEFPRDEAVHSEHEKLIRCDIEVKPVKRSELEWVM